MPPQPLQLAEVNPPYVVQPTIPPKRSHCSTAKSQALLIQRHLIADIQNPKTTATARSQLARAWVAVQDALRVIKGQPTPGQLRPDLDPLQLAKALRRASQRGSITDVKTLSHLLPLEEPPAKESSKESLLPSPTVPTGPTPEEESD